MSAWLKVIKGITTDEHKRRAKICKDCEHAKYKKYIDFVEDELKEIRGYLCDKCGCPLISKIRSTDICKKWEVDTI